MKASSIKYFILDALKSLKRNRTISVAAIVTVIITFFIFGTFTLVAINFNKNIQDVASKVELKVFLDDEIKLGDRRQIEVILQEQPGVKEVIYESKDEAFKSFQESMKENDGILQGYDLTNNPLPASFIVKLEDPNYALDVSNAVRELSGVEDIGNQQDLIDTISGFVKGVQVVGIGLFIIFVAVSIFLITNTIKITVYSRRREVGIMKFVGATDWFIRWPFIIEGVIIGAVGSLLSTGVLYFMYKVTFDTIINNMIAISLVPPTFVFSTLLWGFLAGGIIVGAIGSTTALRKFLDV
ncbi:MAG: permease-like cell division protein FtsX [Clostridium sp.]